MQRGTSKSSNIRDLIQNVTRTQTSFECKELSGTQVAIRQLEKEVKKGPQLFKTKKKKERKKKKKKKGRRGGC